MMPVMTGMDSLSPTDAQSRFKTKFDSTIKKLGEYLESQELDQPESLFDLCLKVNQMSSTTKGRLQYTQFLQVKEVYPSFNV